VAGGYAGLPHRVKRTELYDPASGTWELTNNLDPARWSHTATLLRNGKVLVSGGQDGPLFGDELAIAELYRSAP
jgi:hypothetical protein